MKKLLLSLLLTASAAISSHAYILLQDSLNYPYTNGCIEGQGQWYCYSPNTPVRDADVTNNVLYLNSTNKDSVATPTNSFFASTNGSITFCSFTLNVSQLPSSPNGGYFFQFQDTNGNNCCHIFIDTLNTAVPGTFRLGVGSFTTSFSASQPPINYPEDLSTGVTYTVVCAYDTDQGSPTVGANLWINPSAQDYTNDLDQIATSQPGIGVGYVFGTDKTTVAALLDITNMQAAFSPFVNGGVSNVIVATQFTDALTTNLPVFGIQPQSQTNYSGNGTAFYSAVSGVDLNYQWFSTTSGALSDGANIVGSTSNVLVLNNLSATDKYYVVATDAYGNQVTSVTATNTVITTPTAPFFPTNVISANLTNNLPLNLTNNLFTSSGFTNVAMGTGPLTYQWYFAPTNTPNTYSPLAGQTSSGLSLSLSDYTFAGNYYVVAANAVGGGSVAYGPTNSLAELAPLTATMFQLHNLELSELSQVVANKFGTVNVSTNNLIVSGYVTTYFNLGSSYTEYFIQDTNGYGTEVFLNHFGTTNTPPIGSYVTVTGPLAIFETGLEMEPAAISSVATNLSAPTFAIPPVLANASFNTFATNALGTNALLQSCAMVTFTNVYFYGYTNGAAFGLNGSHSGVGGVFDSNTYTALYITVGGPYGPGNTNVIEDFQPGYNTGTATTQITPNPIAGQPIPTYCAQLTGVYVAFGGSSEIIPSRLADYVVTAPAPFTNSIQRVKKTVTLSWPGQVGSTYSVYSATNVGGPWVTKAYGLNYYPTNTTFVETNTASTQFYKVTSP
jgi:hypothetical protein